MRVRNVLFDSGRAACALAALVSTLAVTTPAAQSLRYVDDQLVLVLRDAPGDSGEKLANVSTGDAVAVLEDTGGGEDRFVRVRLDNGQEGWLPARYLTDSAPARVRLREAGEQIELLDIEREQLSGLNRALELDKRALEDQLNESERARTALTERIARLEETARTTPPSREAQETLRAEKEELDEEARLLRIRNRELRENWEQRWFIAGGAIAVAGMLLGILAGRANARRRSSW